MPKMLLVVVIAACQLLAFCGAQSTYFDVFVPGKQIAGTKSGCPCWFDPAQKFTKATECPCCPEGYKACGYPNHKRCYQAIDPISNLPVASGRRMGCAGTAPYPAWTLSTKGAPCHFNMSDYSCAICGTGKASFLLKKSKYFCEVTHCFRWVPMWQLCQPHFLHHQN